MASASSSDEREAILVIVGHGMVSHRLCELLVERGAGARFRIIVLGEEPEPAYDRVHLGRLLEETQDASVLARPAWYAEHGVELSLGDAVLDIDRQGCTLTTARGRQLHYDRLVLATGARPRMPDVAGLADARPLAYRTLADVKKIREAVSEGMAVGVLGGGLLGIECADALRKLGCKVKVYESSRTLLPRQLDAESARVLKHRLTETGLCVETGFHLLRVTRADDGSYRLHAGSRAVERCQVLILAAGVVPEDDLARRAGLLCAPLGGVAVADDLVTSDPRIFALGDCAAHRGIAPGLVGPGYEMARVLAARLCGAQSQAFSGVDRSCQLKLAGIEVSAFGRYDLEAVYYRHVTKRTARSLVVHQGRLVGATIVGEWDESAALRTAVAEGRPLSARTLEEFLRAGVLGLKSRRVHVAQWPAETVVCHCTGVTRGALGQAGLRCGNDLTQVQQATRAGTVCGSCVPFVAELLGSERPATAVPYVRATGLASASAFVAVLGFVLIPSLPVAASVRQARFALQALWHSSAFRQTTGYALLAIVVIGLLLSARKRLSWFRWGRFGAYRALHTWLGVLSVAALCVHTGMAFGRNLNWMLMTAFLFACVLGGAAGVMSAVEGRATSPRAGAVRAWLARFHVWLLWPLPALLLFHILAAYRF